MCLKYFLRGQFLSRYEFCHRWNVCALQPQPPSINNPNFVSCKRPFLVSEKSIIFEASGCRFVRPEHKRGRILTSIFARMVSVDNKFTTPLTSFHSNPTTHPHVNCHSNFNNLLHIKHSTFSMHEISLNNN